MNCNLNNTKKYQDTMNEENTMSYQNESTFPEFSKILIPEREHDQSDNKISLQEQQSARKQQLINQITQHNQTTVKEENTSITCFICQQYYVKSVLTTCGHSFCQYCLQEYFLFSNQCPICNKVIRDDQFSTNNALNQFVEMFINQNHKEYMLQYQQRVSKFKEWKVQRELGLNYRAGMTLDVRDQNHVWSQGTVIRIISMVNQPVKVLKVQYENRIKTTLYKQKRSRRIVKDQHRVGFTPIGRKYPHTDIFYKRKQPLSKFEIDLLTYKVTFFKIFAISTKEIIHSISQLQLQICKKNYH